MAVTPDLETAVREAVDAANELGARAEYGLAMQAVLDGIARALELGATPADVEALTQAVRELEDRLAGGVEGAEGLLAAELEWVRSLLRLWEVREAVPGGRLAADTGGMGVSRAEFAGVAAGSNGGAEAAALEAARREAALLRGRNDRFNHEAGLAGAFHAPLHDLATRFGLDDVESWIALVLAASSLDPAIDRAYRWAWQDYTQKLPDVGFVRDLLDVLPGDPQAVPDRLCAGGALVRHGLVTVRAPLDRPEAGLVHRQLALAPTVAEALRGRTATDPSLDGLAAVRYADLGIDDLVAPQGLSAALLRLYPPEGPGDKGYLHKAVLVGGRGAGKRAFAGAVAWEGSRPLLSLDLHTLAADPARAATALAAAVRDARLHRALLYVDLRRALSAPDTAAPLAAVLGRGLRDSRDLPVILGARAVGEVLFEEVGDLCELPVAGYGTDELLELWRRSLGARGLEPPDEAALVTTACQPGLTPGMVDRAASEVAAQVAAGDGAAGRRVTEDALRLAVRNQVALGLAGVAQRVSTAMDWDDFVLPDDVLDRLEDIIVHLRYADRVFDDWGFAGRFPYGKGLLTLFSGPPGTGKTMAAGVIAREVGLDLFRVDLSQVVSKWIGETEKTLARIFEEAERARAALLFDEADSLFGRRTDQKTSTDRYANLEVNYLLQRVESYDGLVILTTNYEENIDDAFKRRLRFSIHFPFPDAEARERIWQVLLPKEAEIGDDLDFGELADRFDLAGGNIKNAVLRAAFAAARAGEVIGQDHLIRAAEEEYRALGKLVREES